MRMRDTANRTDRFMLVTFEDHPNCIKVCGGPIFAFFFSIEEDSGIRIIGK